VDAVVVKLLVTPAMQVARGAARFDWLPCVHLSLYRLVTLPGSLSEPLPSCSDFIPLNLGSNLTAHLTANSVWRPLGCYRCRPGETLSRRFPFPRTRR
jgi:hypothetical protein